MSHNNDNYDNITKKLEVKLIKNSNESQLNEPGTSEGYLNEKNINEDNIIVDSDSKIKRTSNKRPASPNGDDSLSDFKLPKLSSKPYLSDNKVRLSIVKPSSSSSRGVKKRGVNRKKPIEKTNQSLLFKPPLNYRCPLCLKSFNDINTQTTHTKNCAAINNVSTEKLLAAAELHERQAEERLAIGLPAAPYQQPRKKTFNIKKMNSVGDPDIQLAIALSKSLSEIEERENFDEALILAAESNENLLQMSSTQRKSTLQNFGFITNKQPVAESTIDKPRRKKNIGPTILQTRTQETRERLLSDKIAEILVGNEGIMQTQLQEDKTNLGNNIDSMSLQSCILKRMHEENNKLWNQSSEIKNHMTYYVQDLSEFISPVVESTNIKLNDKNNENEEIIEDNSENKMDIVEELENNSSDLKLNLEEKSDFKNENNSLSLSWSKMINSNAYSDIIIHVKNNRYIYCHEIVLWTRCQSILQDVVFNDDKLNNQQRKKIQWKDIDFSSAIRFLEFIYCGEINDEKMENNHESLIEINDLAKRYKVDGLLIYLNEKINEENKSIDKNIMTISQPEVNIISCRNEEIITSNEPKLTMNKSESFTKKLLEVNNYSGQNIIEKTPNISRRLQYSCVNTSPDMFEETEIFNSLSNNGKKIDSTISQNSDEEALDALVNLVNDNELLNISEDDEMNKNIDNELSETPKKYLRLSSTCPESLINPSKLPKENKNDNITMLCSTMKRTKSNMSAFIDKIRRKNKKGILDSDSDSEISTQELKNYRRNPFKIRNIDDDSLLLDKYHRIDLKDDEKLSFEEEKEKKSALTLFEDDIRACLEKNHDKFVPFQSQNDSSREIFKENDNKNDEKIEEEEELNIFSDTESDDENDQSMYSKYKRTHRNNSIGNYRNILKNLMKENLIEDNAKNGDDCTNDKSKEETQINSDNDNEDIQSINTTLNKHEISTVNKIRLAELSAFDIYETMTPNSSSLHSSLEDSEKSKNLSPPKTPIELVDLSDDEFPINKSLSDKPSEIIKNASENKSKGITSFESLNQDIEFSNWSDEISETNDWQPLTQSIVNDKNFNENSEVNENKQNNLSNVSLNIADSIDLTQSDDDGDSEDDAKVAAEKLSKNLSHDTITENVTKILKEYGVLDSTVLNATSNNVEIDNNPKPIVLSSSSETESIAGDINNISDNFNSSEFYENLEEFGIEADFEDNFMQSIIEGGADDLHLTPFGTHIEKPSTSGLYINEKNITFRSKHSMNSTSFRSRSINNIDNDLDELPELSLESPNRSRCSSVSLHKQKHSTRFLITKSRSEGNFTSCKNNLINKRNNDNLIIPTNELLLHLNLSSENCEISIDIPPRENYSDMSSPELNKRLAEYGLRNQKHHRAVKLLNYLYDQMHPLVPEYLINSCRMKDNESLTIDRGFEFDDDNKLNREFSESDGESSDNSSKSNSSEIPEEMITLSDDEEYTEKDVVLLRECFQKLLLNDRLLHNKVLMYEPIPLESIHDKLKNEGIKSGLQLLADYLDDECISFYIENPKKGQRHVRKPKKKKK
ncbi:hypothetical protein PV327_009761 [Microctonus hyperodae]|uniref:Structure-specific endonuclease subunit SLX4 n=1 Tax=Microctonus hyperodae TaxID=165561 RepID=A0AA39CB49_MICHY|nr:hypothetical protein PV327_009761 [Microctonus hyperodae]